MMLRGLPSRIGVACRRLALYGRYLLAVRAAERQRLGEFALAGGLAVHCRSRLRHRFRCRGWALSFGPGRAGDPNTSSRAHTSTHSILVMGGDPGAEKIEAKAVPIYAELAAQHMADAKFHQRSFDTTEMYMRRHVVTRWGRVRLTDIDPRDVAPVARRQARRGAGACHGRVDQGDLRPLVRARAPLGDRRVRAQPRQGPGPVSRSTTPASAS